MSALAFAEPADTQGALFGAAARDVTSPAAPAAAGAPLDGPTLDDVISHAWEALGAQVAAACPVCGGEVEPHGFAAGGRCSTCASALD